MHDAPGRHDIMGDTMRWRTGTSVGRTIYLQHGDGPSKGDTLIGVMDTRELAAIVVAAVNATESHAPTCLRRHVEPEGTPYAADETHVWRTQCEP